MVYDFYNLCNFVPKYNDDQVLLYMYHMYYNEMLKVVYNIDIIDIAFINSLCRYNCLVLCLEHLEAWGNCL